MFANRYAFYISGQSGRLYKFLTQANGMQLQSIQLVVSDYPIEEKLEALLQSYSIAIELFDYKHAEGTRLEKNRKLSDFMLNCFARNNIQYAISFGAHILSGKLLEKYLYKFINFHPAILPMFPGVRAIDQAEKHGNVLLVGNTAHFIDAGMDTGPIIMQSVKPLRAFSESRDYDIILDMQISMLNQLMCVLDQKRLRIENGSVVIDGADYSVGHIYPQIELVDEFEEAEP